ncbi:MAG: hypothetical protein ACXW1U_21695 [Methylobacter sp.]
MGKQNDTAHNQTDKLSQQLAAILESLEQMQKREKPYLLALYQTSLGELEYRLLTLQIECRSLQRRIEMVMSHLNRGEALNREILETIRQHVQDLLQQWQKQLDAQAQELATGKGYLAGLVEIDADTVQRTKHAYRRLARLLHPDVSPNHQALFDQYWPSVQDAYRNADADLLEALLQVVTAATVWKDGAEPGQEMTGRLEALIAQHSERLANLRNEAPFCWAGQLHDPAWLSLRQDDLESAINAESARWEILVSRYSKLTANIQPEL